MTVVPLPAWRELPRPRAALVVAAVLLWSTTALLALAAWRADLEQPGGTERGATLDVGVGLALAASAALARGPLPPRLLVWGAALGWLGASVLPVAPWHRGLLVAALAWPPPGASPTRRSACLVVAVGGGLLAGSGTGGRPGTVLVLAVVAVAVAALHVRDVEAWARVVGAVALGSVMGGAWLADRGTRADPAVGLVVYQGVLVAAAGALSASTWAAPLARARRLRRVAGEVGADKRSRRQHLVQDLLREALGDRSLSLETGDAALEVRERPGVRVVRDDGVPVAVISSRAAGLEDAVVGRALDETVRLLVASFRLQDEQERQVAELERARSRLLAADDDARSAVVERLDGGALAALDRALASLDRGPAAGPENPDLTRAREQIALARDDVWGVVRGAAPADLGAGGLRSALHALAEAVPIEVLLDAEDGVAASREVETAAFYVCSEALVNVIKHSGDDRAEVLLVREGDALVVRVRDHGTGGADPRGHGLAGLRDRVEAAGGWLRITDPADGGTLVEAGLPLSPRSVATA